MKGNTPFKRDVRRLAEGTADAIIARNKELCQIHGKVFGVKKKVLVHILIESYGLTDIQDPLQRTAHIASRRAVGIVLKRPFAHFNRRSAFNATTDYIKSQDFVLDEAEKIQLYSMLKFKPSMAVVEAYLTMHLRPK